MMEFQMGMTCMPSPSMVRLVPPPSVAKTMPRWPDSTTGQRQPARNGAAARSRYAVARRRVMWPSRATLHRPALPYPQRRAHHGGAVRDDRGDAEAAQALHLFRLVDGPRVHGDAALRPAAGALRRHQDGLGVNRARAEQP